MRSIASPTPTKIASMAAMLLAVVVCGCPGTTYTPLRVELGDELANFELVAGEPARHQDVIDLGEAPFEASAGVLRFDSDRLSVSPAPGGASKGSVNAHEGRAVEVTVRLASAADVETVCEAGEVFGPFDLDFDTFNEFEASVPAEVPLNAAALELIRAGTMSICIECSAEFAGTVRIGGLIFGLAP